MLRRLTRYLVAIIGNQAISLANGLLLVPLFLRHWSAEVYGEWLALSSVALYFSTLDLGMNTAVGNRMMVAHARGDRDDYLRCQHSALMFYGSLAIAATIATGLASWALPVSKLLRLHSVSQHDAAMTIWLLGLQVLWMLPCGFVGNIYRTIGDPARTQWVTNSRYILMFCTTVTALAMHATMPELALAQLVPTVIVTCCVLVHIKLRSPHLFPSVRRAEKAVMRELLAPSLQFAVIMIAVAITQQGSVLVLSRGLGGVAVAVFVTTRTLTNLVMQVFMTVNMATQPNITIQFAQGNLERLRGIHRILVASSTSLCIATATALWFEGPEIVTRWTHGKLHLDPTFLHLMLLYTVLQAPWRGCSTIAIAINRHRHLSTSYIASSVIGVGVAAALLRHLGLIAVPIGLIVGEAVSCYHFVVQDACFLVKEKYAAFAARTWLAVASLCFIGIAAGGWGHAVARGPNILRWVEVGTITFIPVLAAMWIIWMNRDDRSKILTKVRGMFPARTVSSSSA
ncbi:MAG: lipopolysaccharide biosynthesis protein [Capsulimonadaceae bacterium]